MDDTTPFINTSTVMLTAEQLKLADFLSRHNHAAWMQWQQAQGWSHGREHREGDRLHPYLLPYSRLPASEQQARDFFAQETLKALSALGYRLEASDAASPIRPEDQDLALLLQGLQSSSGLSLSSLLDLRREAIRLRPCTVEFYRILGDAILQLGEPLLAYDILAEGLKYYPNDIRLQQLVALALARSGSTVSANTLLLKLAEACPQDEETLGLLARTHKDLWLQASDPATRQHHLKLAAEYYLRAYQIADSLWTGINAATLARIMGEVEQAHALAREVQTLCYAKLSPSGERTSSDYWVLATLGEAALILDEGAAAEDFYRQAVAVGQGRFGDLSSTRRNALLLVEHLGHESQGAGKTDRTQIQQWFQMPRVVVFCGHMLDRPHRPHPRFPVHLERAVYDAIRDRLQTLDARLGYASAACGSDILFLEAIRELGGEMHIMLPCDREQFIQESVNIIPGSGWVQRFEELLSQATEVITASDRKLQQNDVVYEYSNRLLHGLAKMRAEQLSTELVPLTVWNGQPGDGPGGTAGTIELWKQWAEHIEVIDLNQLLQQTPITLPAAPAISAEGMANPASDTSPERQIRALLFADVVNYSQLNEDQYLPFVQHFLGATADLAGQEPYQPLFKNTWGDALYFVFATVRQAGRFALDLCDLIQTVDWSSRHLPPDLNLRIALHAGPVEQNTDPITGQINYIGTHVNHTARIEPITPPGKVYASQAFAAIATSEGVQDFTCDYVGQMPWAKHYGTFPTYHIRRRFT